MHINKNNVKKPETMNFDDATKESTESSEIESNKVFNNDIDKAGTSDETGQIESQHSADEDESASITDESDYDTEQEYISSSETDESVMFAAISDEGIESETEFDVNAGGRKKRKKDKKNKKGKRKSKKKIVIIVIIIIALIATALGLKGCSGNKESQPSYETGLVEKSDVRQEISVRGIVEGADSAEVSSSLNYEIVQINVHVGDRVKKGDVIAVLDSSELKREYTLTESQYKASQYTLESTLKTTQDEYDAAVRDMNEAKRVRDSNTELYDQGAIPYSDYIETENTYQTKKAHVETFSVQNGKVVASAAQKQSLETERLTLESKKASLDEVNIKSPITGTVTRVNATLGRYPGQSNSTSTDSSSFGNAMFVIEDIDNLKMEVNINENDINDIKVGQSVTLNSEVLDEGTSVTGVVSNISPSGEKKDASSTEMVIPVTISINNANSKLMAGVTAKGTILVKESKQAKSVPVEAIYEDVETGETSLYVLRDGKIKITKVELGTEGDFTSEVISDEIAEGDTIILNPSSEMTDGMSV